MISQPGDKRTVLIAALIAIPAACLVTMIIHTFVPAESSKSFAGYVHVSEAPAHHGIKGKKRHFDPQKKEAMRKRFAAARKARLDALKKIADLSAERLALLKKNPKASAKEIINAQTDVLLAQGALFRAAEKVRLMGTPQSDAVVRLGEARATAAALKKSKSCKIACLESEIASLKLELQLKNNRLYRNPDWKNACEAFLKKPGLEQLKVLYRTEAENQNHHRPRRHR